MPSTRPVAISRPVRLEGRACDRRRGRHRPVDEQDRARAHERDSRTLSRAGETAYAKLNLALHVRERMADGYHRIETIFAFCEDGDELTPRRRTPSRSKPVAVRRSVDSTDNLVLHAAEAFQQASKTQAGASLILRKMLPVASGLGGGSADAAATLRLLNQLWG
jgi:4-diphosphocytidyl-2C-methyl-D-erythritol kinase